MAATNGYKTTVRIGTTKIVLMDGWSLAGGRTLTEYISFGTTYMQQLPGPKNWTATAKGTLDRSATGQSSILDQFESSGADTALALRFYTTTGNAPYWGGNAFAENFDISADVAGKVSVSFSFKGDGAIAWTSST